MTARVKTKYPGVYYKIKKQSVTGKEERIYYIQYRTPDKKQHHEKIGTTSTGLTDAKANAIRTDRMRGKEQTNTEKREQLKNSKNKWTINKLWEEYKINNPIKSLPKDQQRYSFHVAKRFGDKTPEELSPLDIDRLRINLLKTRKPATVRHVLELLRRPINFGVRRGLCEPLKFKIEMPKVNNIKTEDLTQKQLQSLLSTLNDEPNIQLANLMKLVLFSGMRRSEMLNLKWKDIDFEKGFILIRAPKGAKDERIPLNDASRNLFENHPKVCKWVFVNKFGEQRKDSKREIRKLADKAGLPKDFRPLHGLRHVYASMLASSGKVDMYTLQKLLTHKSPQMTQRYAHLRDDALKRASQVAVDIVQDIINEQETEQNQVKQVS